MTAETSPAVRPGRLADAVCVVTGGGSGIGRATAREMAREGARAVAVLDLDGDGAAETAAAVRAEGAASTAITCDVTRAGDVARAMEEVAGSFGGIDVLHNNVGVEDGQLTDATVVDELPEDVFSRVFDVNVKSVFLCTKHAAPYLRRSEYGGAVINASSVSGLVAYQGETAYSAAKAAVIMLTKSLALEMADDGVRVNCYCPGSIDTPMIQHYLDVAPDRAEVERVTTGSHLVHRLGRPEEVAKLVCFLASRDASFITGAAMLVDGGALAWRSLHT